MIDLRLLREDPDRVRASQRARGEDVALVDALLSADELRRSSGVRFDELRSEQKSLGKQIPRAQGEEKQQLLARTKELAVAVKAAEAAQAEAEAAYQRVVMTIPNPAAEESPAGGEDDFIVLEHVGEPRDFAAEGFAPRDHIELGRMLGAIDIERGAKVSGSRFYFLTGVGAQLELALLNMAVAQATAAGFKLMITPTLVRPEIMASAGGYLSMAALPVTLREAEPIAREVYAGGWRRGYDPGPSRDELAEIVTEAQLIG